MERIYEGKTKDVYSLDDGHILLRFKDDVTGVDGVFDPGANSVGLTLDGAGKAGLKMTKFFFEKINGQDIYTHFVDADLGDVSMTVEPAVMFGQGLEVICRYKAVGSFYRRYGAYCEEGDSLERFVEITLKDDERGDPPISKQGLNMLGILKGDEYETIVKMTRDISDIVKVELAKKELDLFDIKLEFGRHKETGKIMLIDEISGGNMRVFDKNGEYVEPLDLEKRVLK